MSSCRCSDISNTENKIRKLENAKRILAGYSAKKEGIANGLASCSSNAKQATVSEKVASYHGTMISLGNGIQQAANGTSGKINSKLGELNSSLNNMRHEDHEYHEEERRKREAEEKRKAEEAAKAAAAAAMKWVK